MQRPKPEEFRCKRPSERQRQNRHDRRQNPEESRVWAPERRQHRSAEGAIDENEADDRKDEREKRQGARLVQRHAALERDIKNADNGRRGEQALEQAPGDESRRRDRFGRRARRPPHDVVLLGLGLEHQRADRIDHHFDESDMDRPEQHRQAEDERRKASPAIGTWTARMKPIALRRLS